MSLDKKSLQIKAKSCDFILNPGNIRKSENKVIIMQIQEGECVASAPKQSDRVKFAKVKLELSTLLQFY